ncbi:hypothetical protein ACFV9E_17975 [Streptomyces sp. NPDC059835]|uniref:hypothetical protein n=1 Tax=Streptomyces sp. NPDC059835 TaxID=3346967 RepID=UPI00364F2E6F
MEMKDEEERLPRFQRARNALERFAPVFWMKSTSETNHMTGFVQLPSLGWRFSEPHPELREMFQSVVRDAPRNTDWSFKEKKNSLILPSRLISEGGPDGDFGDLASAISQNDQEFCIAASDDIELIIDAIAAQPALPTATRISVFQIAKSSADELVCVAEGFTGEPQVGMVFQAVGVPGVEVRLTALRWYPPRPETKRHDPLAKVTLVGKGAGLIGRKDLLVSLPGGG